VNPSKPVLITAGEPGGIGPDITLDIIDHEWRSPLVVIADPALLHERAVRLGKKVQIIELETLDELPESPDKNAIYALTVDLYTETDCGQLKIGNSQYVIDCLDVAGELCRTHQCAALVTGPVHKGIINDAGIHFTGHTEYLAKPANCNPVMMLATNSLRVALATTHLPLRDVSAAITYDSLVATITTLNDFLLKNCNLSAPKICICGLNPHAGEDGHLGTEEIDTIIPAINTCISKGIDASLPIPADTAFTSGNLKHYDAVLAMYHDQGLPVIKHLGFGEAVNITLGLPFIRTSVDHGTALELAGTGKAKSTSLIAAINMAIKYSE